jgi:hypothetical protein
MRFVSGTESNRSAAVSNFLAAFNFSHRRQDQDGDESRSIFFTATSWAKFDSTLMASSTDRLDSLVLQ